MILGAVYKPALVNLARVLSTVLKQRAAFSSPSCNDCQLAAVLRAEFPGAGRRRLVRVHQCPNCAKIIWESE